MMKRIFQKRYVFLLAFLSLVLFSLKSEDKRIGTHVPILQPLFSDYYHGKSIEPIPLNSSCYRSDGCHLEFPHGKDQTASPFLNMHTLTIDCFVCHETPDVKLYVESTNGKKLFRADGMSDRGDIHAIFGKAPECRKCHSPSGKKNFEEKTGVLLKANFSDLYILKLIEEGSKKWDIPGF